MEYITADQIDNAVFMAIDDNKYLPVDEPISLEYLDQGDDGIFPNRASWIAFLNGNFREYGELYLGGTVKPGTLKRWCYPLEQYRDRFVVKVGPDRFVRVNADDLEFAFTYDINLYSRTERSDYPSAAELFVTATIK
jgi:hypothetical protein